MAITITWKVPSLQVNPSLEGKTNVVTAVNWLCEGVDAEKKISYAESGIYPVELSQSFTPYEQLQPAQVLAWVQTAQSSSGTFQSMIEGLVSSTLQAKINNTTDTETSETPIALPWAAS
jgi:hypothetical protein